MWLDLAIVWTLDLYQLVKSVLFITGFDRFLWVLSIPISSSDKYFIISL